MHIIHKITLQSMRQNKRRTLVTLIGVILSVSMICALTTLVQSFQDLLIRNTIRLSGSYEIEYYDVPKDKADVIIKDENTKESLISYCDSVVKVSNKDRKHDTYAEVNVYDMKHLSLNGLTLLKGELPTQKDEILLSKQMAIENAGMYNIGDTITLPIGYYANKKGKREYSQFHRDLDTTKFIQTGTRTFHITGILNNDTIMNSGYEIFLPLQGNEGTKDTKYVISVVTNTYHNTMYEEAEQFLSNHQLEDVTINLHQDLLAFYGSDKGLYHGAIIILSILMGTIIFIASFALIYNTFSISLTQRSTYLGILSSIGTTKRQKRNAVLFEALIVSCVGIPIGMLAGYLGVAITFACVQPILHTALKASISIHMIITWQAVLITIVSSICIIFFSAWIPAHRASKISAMTAIRQTKEIKVSGKDVKISRFTRKLFGYEAALGLKNRKRNQHHSHTIIYSLIISVILFMSSLSFTSFLKAAVQMKEVQGSGDIIVNMEHASTSVMQDNLDSLLKLPNIDSYEYSNRMQVRDEEHALQYTNEVSAYLNKHYFTSEHDDGMSIDILALDDKSFQAYVKEIGVDAKRFESGKHVILVNSESLYASSNKQKHVRLLKPVKDNSTLHVVKGGYIKNIQSLTISSSTTILPDALNQTEDTGREDVVSIITNEKTFHRIANGFSNDEERSITTNLQLNSADANQLESDILQVDNGNFQVDNRYAQRAAANAISIFASTFLYGFFVLVLLICSINIYNTMSTGLTLRKHEFAMMKSIGITKQKFYKMILYECLCYAGNGLFYGFILSLFLHYGMYRTIAGIDTNDISYFFLLRNMCMIACIIISILVCSALLTIRKLDKEGIVETIRNENI